ncbi:MAG TPA: metal ABC transporter ATP-binding protein [Syntrophobacteraceae bacterium]|nr:metal ABC transporter ATP-binding protein [Syntrophobacteraceae bacterium]
MIAGAFAIEVDDLWFSYDGNLVLRGVNLRIEHGDFLAILGPNGSGKTTFLKLLLGILTPSRGTIRIYGKEPGKIADRIGYVPQDTSVNKGFPISVLDVTLMGRLGQPGRSRRYSTADRSVAQSSLERVGMWEYRDRPIGKLSGGQRQRVYIARALTAQPDILFMDEPTASTDKEFQTELYDFLKELNESMTVVVVSHDLSVLSSYIKSVACLSQTLYHHDAAEITSEMIEKAYHCPVELIAHGLPHRVLRKHEDH